jgi:hypothetical protein
MDGRDAKRCITDEHLRFSDGTCSLALLWFGSGRSEIELCVVCCVDVSIFSTQHRSLGSLHEPQLQPFPSDISLHADLICIKNTRLIESGID